MIRLPSVRAYTCHSRAQASDRSSVGNANCASTCALFSSALYERHGTKFAIFGGKPGESIQIKGMAGNQVLEWADLDTEIKTAELGNDPLVPPNLLVDGNMRVNWRTAWAWSDLSKPIGQSYHLLLLACWLRVVLY